MHAVFHLIVENQIALGVPRVVDTLQRLVFEGLDRHEALHAVASVLAERLHVIIADEKADNGEYFEALQGLTATKWRAGAG